MSEEPTDFGFDLDIEKEAPAGNIDTTTDAMTESQPKQTGTRRNSKLLNTKSIQIDEETENSESIASSNTYKEERSNNLLTPQPTNFTTKRLWSEITEICPTPGEVAPKAIVQMAKILRKELSEEKEVIFTDVLKSQANTEPENITKREASRGFFDILSLATEGCIGLSQTEAFGNIKIDAKPALFERFINA
ncbi:Conserved region of Rad21 / Rec8 like family protein [Saccharomyces cerevisiae]|nr:Conserved region of Rad21 / Rec8 like family protein [Saccharomyces cerevisiae]